MDILTHTISGVAIGTVISSFSKKGIKEQLNIILISGFAGAFPDIDAISLWSQFDSVFGSIFNLDYKGKVIYSEKFWYSHHAFFHSITASVLFPLIFSFLFFTLNRKKANFFQYMEYMRSNYLLILGFALGFLIHILEDMPTPSSSWGGVNLFWPLEQYIGGYGKIWWWNNYDIFLITLMTIFINIILITYSKFKEVNIWKLTTSVFIGGLIISLLQINTRIFSYKYNNKVDYITLEQKSKDEQKRILGEKIFMMMEKLDNIIPLYF